jgi:hypothetical protein
LLLRRKELIERSFSSLEGAVIAVGAPPSLFSHDFALTFADEPLKPLL